MDIINHYFYTKEHEWIDVDGKTATVGITDYAQSALGDITYIELPAEDVTIEQFEQLTSLESVKSASDIYCPMSGRIIEVNADLSDDPGLINRDPYEKGWIARIEISDESETSNLLTADEYRNYLESIDRHDGGSMTDIEE